MKTTTPPSSALDTLKALALRNIDHLIDVINQLGSGDYDVPDELLELLDWIRLAQYEALNEHMDVEVDERLGELRILPREAFEYDDGTPVKMFFKAPSFTSHFFPRYTPIEVARQRHLDSLHSWVLRRLDEAEFNEIIRSNGLGEDA